MTQSDDSIPITFRLIRKADVSGTSGTGHVADGVQFPDGTCVLRWRTAKSSTAVYASHADVMAIHGHDGATVCEWASFRRPECCAATKRASTDDFVRFLIKQGLGPFGKLTGRSFAEMVAGCILATEPTSVTVEEVAALDEAGGPTLAREHDIAARLNGPSPAEVAALLRDIGHGYCGSCDRRVCPSCSADLDVVTIERPDGKCFADCKLAAMIKQCEGA